MILQLRPLLKESSVKMPVRQRCSQSVAQQEYTKTVVSYKHGQTHNYDGVFSLISRNLIRVDCLLVVDGVLFIAQTCTRTCTQ